MRRPGWVVVCLACALIAYHLAWYTHATAGFTTNAFDLAEWTSLHPAVRSSSPPLLTSFLLRLPLVGLLAAALLAANGFEDARARWIARVVIALPLLRLVPPKDFFTTASADPNYRQMALLVVIGGALWLASPLAGRLPERWQAGLMGGALLVSAIAGWAGLSRAHVLLDNFEIHVRVGPGLPLLIAASVCAVAVGLLQGGARRTASAG